MGDKIARGGGPGASVFARRRAEYFAPLLNLRSVNLFVRFVMKTLTFPILALAGLIVLGGCSTPEARIQKNPAAFDRCTPEQQDLIKHGQVALGFDEEMVKLALGDPDRITTRTDASGTSEVWHYETYEADNGVILYTGYYHHFWGAPLYPYYLDYPARRVVDRFRVAFQGGKVVSIEQDRGY